MRRLISTAWLSLVLAQAAHAQPAPGEMRVSVVLNNDGSRTVYETDAENRKSIATTTSPKGEVREKIKYDLDENGRYIRSEVCGPKDEFRFFALYKYDAENRLSEETHLDKDQRLVGKIVFLYDPAGHRVGYATYDGAGKLLGQTAAATPARVKRK
jgi:YD repeat-containing protein